MDKDRSCEDSNGFSDCLSLERMGEGDDFRSYGVFYRSIRDNPRVLVTYTAAYSPEKDKITIKTIFESGRPASDRDCKDWNHVEDVVRELALDVFTDCLTKPGTLFRRGNGEANL